MSHHEPPQPGPDSAGGWGSPPNPYGPPPQQPQGNPTWPAAPQGPPPGHQTPPGQAWPQQQPYAQQGWAAGPMNQGPGWSAGPPPKRRRTGAILASALLALALLTGGGIAIALATQDDDGDKGRAATDPEGTPTSAPSDEPTSAGTPTEDPSASPSETPSATTTAPSPESTGTDTPNIPGGTGPDTTGRKIVAADYQDDWEFKWEDTELNARHVVSRDLESCKAINPDNSLAGKGCKYAVTATFVNEQDKVKFTHVFLVFKNEKQAKAANRDKGINDGNVTLKNDALWEDFDKGMWIAKQVKEFVVFTAATGPKGATNKRLEAYLKWSNTDYSVALRF